MTTVSMLTPRPSEWRRKSLQAIRKDCETLQTAPELTDILLDGLTECFNNSLPPAKSIPNDLLNSLTTNDLLSSWTNKP